MLDLAPIPWTGQESSQRTDWGLICAQIRDRSQVSKTGWLAEGGVSSGGELMESRLGNGGGKEGRTKRHSWDRQQGQASGWVGFRAGTKGLYPHHLHQFLDIQQCPRLTVEPEERFWGAEVSASFIKLLVAVKGMRSA